MKITVVGAGLMGRWHAYTAKRLGARIVGVVDIDIDAARRLAARFGALGAYTSLDDLFRSRTTDIVHVCTPLDSHLEASMTAIAHGAHVVCEKPLALSAPQTRELLARARRADKKICPVHQFAKQRGVSKARRLLGGLGSLSSIRFEICSAGAADTDPTAHGNVLADILPHPLSVAACLWPEARLDEIEWQVITPTPGEVSAQCLVQNTPMTLSISMSGRPTRCAMEIQGSQGRLLVDFFHGFCVCFRGSVSRSRKVLYPFADSARTFAAAAGNLTVRVLRREPAYPGLEQLLRDFYAAVDEDADLSAADEVAVAIAVARDEFMRAMSLQATNPAAVPLDQARPG